MVKVSRGANARLSLRPFESLGSAAPADALADGCQFGESLLPKKNANCLFFEYWLERLAPS